jgi:ABC-type dipeptide/oligopeptide/nickel transport system permease subunit
MPQGAQLSRLHRADAGLYSGLAITVVVLAFNFLGDGLRDPLDPRRRR